MTTTATTILPSSQRSLDAVLLQRRGSVYLPDPAPSTTSESLAGITLLESDLIDRGFLVSAPLREALSALAPEALSATGNALLAHLDAQLGADRDHTPLFRRFPQSVPGDTLAFWTDRVLTLLLQAPEQPCVLCGTSGSVHPVAPCAHLVCRTCFDGADFSACPICHRRIDPADPFLRPAQARPTASARRALPARLRVLSLGGGPTVRHAHAADELNTLMARTGALSPQDTDDLAVLLDGAGDRANLGWLPETIPGRETKARVLSWLLDDRAHFAVTLPAVTARLTTATDVLRLLAVRSGGDPGLTDATRLTAVPRPLRRALLQALDRMTPQMVAEDLSRRPGQWKAVAERLHVFEYADRYPRASLAFAALRSTPLGDDALSRVLRGTAQATDGIDADGDTIRVPLWAGEVETALASADVPGALTPLSRRPGELVRRLDHLLRLAGRDGAEPVLAALRIAAPRVAPAVLLSALGAVRSRTQPPLPGRVFFPKGATARAYITSDERAPLDPGAAETAVHILTDEILRRAATLPAADVAVLDAELDGLIAPFAERTASRALVTLPRGSELPVPDGRTLRLFLHWMESAESGRTDLDLSVALFNERWEHVGTCAYTNLRFGDDAAVHSGDLTSAPPPHGASEFVDLDLDKLAALGVRYAVSVVYSFNNIPFVKLDDAFAGLMARDEPGSTGAVFDARQVEQRYDLTSASRASVPLVVDVAGRTMRWLDVAQGVTGTHHAVHRHADDLAVLAEHLTALFASGARVSLGELALWHAAARARTVVVRHHDGSTSTYRRQAEEDVTAFAARIGAPSTDDPADARDATLAYLLRGDITLPDGAEAYALHPAALDAAALRMQSASDLVASLTAH
ncbi:MXAN_6230/SCO0854 family RING domain-containing protein [Streptomyces sp. NPDC014983]|uniref:MXAN_6230/SCO0854 family RING domain-containing protein n=1 Tax=Streptomyces sp. NPDC014983 TaxID=3364933 RepID=UPI0037010FD9